MKRHELRESGDALRDGDKVIVVEVKVLEIGESGDALRDGGELVFS